jgi:hypothetical protein
MVLTDEIEYPLPRECQMVVFTKIIGLKSWMQVKLIKKTNTYAKSSHLVFMITHCLFFERNITAA